MGAYFGLAASWVLGRPAKMEKEGASLISDLTAFIGTLFLWLYWPSFVAGAIPAGSVEWDTALSNTVLALLGSTVSSFIASAALSGPLSMNRRLGHVPSVKSLSSWARCVGTLAFLFFRHVTCWEDVRVS